MKIKSILIAASLFGFAGLTQAGDENCQSQCETKVVAKAEACESECASKTMVKAEKCESECASKTMVKAEKCESECADKVVMHYNVTGMTCGGCSKKLTSALTAIEGVEVKKVCHKSGNVDVALSKDAKAAKVAEVSEAITKTGFKITPAKEEKKG